MKKLIIEVTETKLGSDLVLDPKYYREKGLYFNTDESGCHALVWVPETYQQKEANKAIIWPMAIFDDGQLKLKDFIKKIPASDEVNPQPATIRESTFLKAIAITQRPDLILKIQDNGND